VEALVGTLGALHAHGVTVDWEAFFGPYGLRRKALPTYAFQRERFWLEGKAAKGDVASAGLTSAEHPLLGAAIPLAHGDGLLFTGRLSLTEQPWLAGHEVFGKVILPGTAFLELALYAAQRVGLDVVEELTLETPLVLPEHGAIQVQLSVGGEDGGRRELTLHGRAADAAPDAPWTRHASGKLGPNVDAAPSFDLREWPPRGAEAGIDSKEYTASWRPKD